MELGNFIAVIYNSQLLAPILGQVHPVQVAQLISLRSVSIFAYHYLRITFLTGLLPAGFPTRILCIF
jgi:hypothetical protein